MYKTEAAVTEFHHKHGFAVGKKLPPKLGENNLGQLVVMGHMLRLAAEHLGHLLERPAALDKDQLLRCHLMMEELFEVVDAIVKGDELALLDGLADLVYVTVGTAVTFGLPLPEALREVCQSNATKSGARVRADAHPKGRGYQAPDLRAVLQAGRPSRLAPRSKEAS